jgi:hypothetical protein
LGLLKEARTSYDQLRCLAWEGGELTVKIIEIIVIFFGILITVRVG